MKCYSRQSWLQQWRNVRASLKETGCLQSVIISVAPCQWSETRLGIRKDAISSENNFRTHFPSCAHCKSNYGQMKRSILSPIGSCRTQVLSSASWSGMRWVPSLYLQFLVHPNRTSKKHRYHPTTTGCNHLDKLYSCWSRLSFTYQQHIASLEAVPKF